MGKKLILALVTFTVVATLLAAGAPPPPPPEAPPAPPEPPPPPVPTAPPAPPPPLGTADNPLIMGFVPSGTAQEILTGGEAIAKQITDLTGYQIKVFQATSYSALVEAMGSGNAQIGWVAPFSPPVAP